MILGIGTDLTKVERFVPWLTQPALMGRYFSLLEIGFCMEQGTSAAMSLAARFAAKEAFGKALGYGLRGIRLRDISVEREDTGRPYLVLKQSALNALNQRCAEFSCTYDSIRLHLSLSHEKEHALAFVVIESLPQSAPSKEVSHE